MHTYLVTFELHFAFSNSTDSSVLVEKVHNIQPPHTLYMGKFWWGIFTDKPNAFDIQTDCILFAKFFLTNSFYLHSSPKFSPAKYFPCTVYILAIAGIDHCYKSKETGTLL